jgi:hypothetical protein
LKVPANRRKLPAFGSRKPRRKRSTIYHTYFIADGAIGESSWQNPEI